MNGLPGKPASYWLERSEPSAYPSLDAPIKVDVAVLGAGISGVSVALELAEAGLEVALVEAGRVAGGASGYSTAKVSSLHGLTYAKLAAQQSEEIARAYGQANEAGLAAIAARVDALGIDCDFSRRDNFTYTLEPGEASEVEAEVEAATAAGLPASHATELDLPFPVAAAVRFGNQAQFDPVRYLRALAARFAELGGRLFERSPAIKVNDGKPCTVAGPRRRDRDRGARRGRDPLPVPRPRPLLRPHAPRALLRARGAQPRVRPRRGCT